MADPAFDAFSQRRNTGTKDRVTERRRVDTYTDPNRYQMPPRRRLSVHASNKSMFVTPEKENITALAEGLAKIQPDIMGYIADRQIEANKKQIEYGKLDAMGMAAEEAGDTEFVDNEWRQFGYEQQSAFLLGESLANDLAVKAANRDLHEPYEEWYARWWEDTNAKHPGIATMNPEHMESFNKPLIKGVTQAKNNDLVLQEKKLDAEQKAVASQVIYEEYADLYTAGNINEEAWIAMKKDLTYLNRLTHKEQTDIKVDTLIRIAEENLDASAFNILMKPGLGIQKDPNGIDQVTEMPNSLYNDPDYHKAIKTSMEKIASKKASNENAKYTAKQREKALYNEYETDGHKEISNFIGYDPAIVMSMDPERREIAKGLEDAGKSLFTKHYEANLESMPHEEAMKKAVEATKEEMYVYESPGGFKARQEYARWFNDSNYKIKKTISTPMGKAKLAEVYASEGEAGFTNLFGTLGDETIKQLTIIAQGNAASLKIKARKSKNNLPETLVDKGELGQEKIDNYNNNINTVWEDYSNEFNQKFLQLRALPTNDGKTDLQIRDAMIAAGMK